MDLNDQRREYRGIPLEVEAMPDCPVVAFKEWYEMAKQREVLESNAMSLATVDAAGRPAIRTVLLKYFDPDGFVFFTNYQSRKARHIESNPEVALLFQWLEMERQIEINGAIEKVSLMESVKYFSKRPRESQLGAWISEQSTVVPTKDLLKSKLANYVKKFATGTIPKPEHWGGYRIIPRRYEFWQGGPGRIHDRIEYLPCAETNQWRRGRLSP
ncbi:MAG: pyridoxamine 5'-phosphate oxidase [Planctomycetaceae bacterium]|nr:pyridoxamine 5'-phosphate oxidase [Planctomycetaceae bacterium]MCP4772916.1 pyridoxamine 5'-phosphate oxidase [Planctomycetaceae bacterium]